MMKVMIRYDSSSPSDVRAWWHIVFVPSPISFTVSFLSHVQHDADHRSLIIDHWSSISVLTHPVKPETTPWLYRTDLQSWLLIAEETEGSDESTKVEEPHISTGYSTWVIVLSYIPPLVTRYNRWWSNWKVISCVCLIQINSSCLSLTSCNVLRADVTMVTTYQYSYIQFLLLWPHDTAAHSCTTTPSAPTVSTPPVKCQTVGVSV